MNPQDSVMIVDDEQIVARDLEASLRRRGYTVTGVAATADEAITLTASSHPDLVLMDIRLRGPMDGIDAARLIRARTGTPVVYMTAYADPETIDRARDTEPYGYLVKPWREDELHATVQMALSKHRIESKQSEAALRRDAIIHAAVDAVVVMDGKGAIVELNPAAERLFSFKAGEAQGRLFSEFIAPELNVNPQYMSVFQALATPAGALPGHRVELSALRLDGSSFPAELVMVHSQADDRTLYIAFVRDITERKRTQSEVDRLLNSLLRSLGQKKPLPDFVAVCASCKQVRNDAGDWARMESFFRQHLEITFTHGYCPDCAARLIAASADRIKPPGTP
jgi:PAS domain S-box-containing protein